ncbi:MAG: TIR domain-containing protein [Anaerolineae bacterium]|nr:TIR domain-containing protein [Anaerolineae bacterium]
MADVFISYSRRDGEFVQRLNHAFVSANRVVWIDWQSIPRGEDWWREIESGIEGADSFICVVSEHWLTSEICHRELRYARQNNKRILPVIRQEIKGDVEKQVKGTWMDLTWEQDARNNWDYIRHLNWVFFDDDTRFDTEFPALLTALEEDQPHIKAHTRYQTRALEWERSNHNPSFLLKGDELSFAETWLASSAGKDPQPTEQHTAFIQASRDAEDRKIQEEEEKDRRTKALEKQTVALEEETHVAADENRRLARRSTLFRRLIAALIVVIIATIATGLFVANRAVTAEKMANTADAQVIRAISTQTALAVTIAAGEAESVALQLAAESNRVRLANGSSDLAVLLGIRSLQAAYTTEGDIALQDAVDLVSSQQFAGHIGAVTSAAFSPDGRYILTGSADSTARLWETNSGAEVRRLVGHTSGVTSVAFSPDGSYILTGSADSTARLWETNSGAEVRRLVGHTSGVTSVAFSPDGRYILTGSADGTARLWETNSGAEVRRLVGHTSGVTSVAFSPDGRYVLTGGGTARLWDVATGVEIRQFAGDALSVTSVAFSPDGRYILTGSDDSTARLWEINISSKTELRQFIDDTGSVNRAVFSPDGRYVLIGSDGMVRLWEVTTGKIQSYRVSGVAASIYSVAFSPDGRHALFVDENRSIYQWDILSGRPEQEFQCCLLPAWDAALSPDGRYALIGDGRRAWMWDIATKERIRVFDQDAFGVAFSPDGRYALTGSKDGTARLWDVASGAEVRQFVGHTGLVFRVAFSPDGRYILTGSADGTARLWETNSGAEVRRFVGHTGSVRSVAFSPYGRYILTGSENNVAQLWNVVTGAQVRVFSGHREAVTSVAFSPDGYYVLTGSEDGTARLWLNVEDFPIFACAYVFRDFTFDERYLYNIPIGATCPQFAPNYTPPPPSPTRTSVPTHIIRPTGTILPAIPTVNLTQVTATPSTTSIPYTYSTSTPTHTSTPIPTLIPITLDWTPYPSRTPIAPSWTPLASLTATNTPSATSTPISRPAEIGNNQGEIPIGGVQVWTYQGQAGETLTVWAQVNKDDLLNTVLYLYAPDGTVLIPGLVGNSGYFGVNLEEFKTPQELLVNGIYRIEVRGYANESGGPYTLVIESDLGILVTTTTLARTPIPSPTATPGT